LRLHALEIADRGEDGETSNETEARVTEGDTEGVANNGLVDVIVRGVGGHNAHAYTNREENLSASFGPHGRVLKFLGDVGVDELSRELVTESVGMVELSDSSIISGFGHLNSDTLEVHADTLVGVVQSESIENHE